MVRNNKSSYFSDSTKICEYNVFVIVYLRILTWNVLTDKLLHKQSLLINEWNYSTKKAISKANDNKIKLLQT